MKALELGAQCLTYDNSINIILVIATGRRKGVRAKGIAVGPNPAMKILLHVAQ